MPKNLKEVQDRYNHSEKGIARSRRQQEKRKAQRLEARLKRNRTKAALIAKEEAHYLAGEKYKEAYDSWLAAHSDTAVSEEALAPLQTEDQETELKYPPKFLCKK